MLGLDSLPPQIRLVDIDTLVPYLKNSRYHSPAHVQQVATSMITFGWTNPMLIDDAGIVAGHGRQLSAMSLYQKGVQLSFPDGTPIPIGKVPVIDCTGWDEARRKAYIIADNQLGLASEWNMDALRDEMKDLDNYDFNLEIIGFTPDQLDEIMKVEPTVGGGGGDPDKTPELPEEPVSRMGDIWILGAHRVMVGDAEITENWLELMRGEQANIIWTDPPYNVDIGKKNKRMDKAIGGDRSRTGAIANDWKNEEDFNAFLVAVLGNLYNVTAPGGIIYLSHSDKMAHGLRWAFDKVGYHFSQNIIWKKNKMVLGMADFQPIHEPILYGWRKGSKHRWHGGRKQTTVMELGDRSPFQQDEQGRYYIQHGDQILLIEGDAKVESMSTSVLNVPKPDRSDLHPTQKPVELVERTLRNSTRLNDILVDAFSGSGTSLIAAERMGLCARVMEMDLGFADVTIRRWQDLTGRKAIHAVTGEEFPAEGSDRKVPDPDDGDDPF
ncbi:DNA methyltransferase [Yersinia phage fHe-Yen8-01]|nr:DNA methyltransferase [Yersinia phage fHe-Yen8-01]